MSSKAKVEVTRPDNRIATARTNNDLANIVKRKVVKRSNWCNESNDNKR